MNQTVNMITQLNSQSTARGQSVQLLDIQAPVQSWSEPEDVMATSFLEADVTASPAVYAMAERASDTRTTVFLDPMVDQQIVAEHEVAIFRSGPLCEQAKQQSY